MTSRSIFCCRHFWKTSYKVVHLVSDRFLIQIPNTIQSNSLKSFDLRISAINLFSAASKLTATETSRNYSTMSSKPILYSYFRSGASWRIRIVLAHKGIDYEYRSINLLKNEQVDEEYLKINPMGQVPTLVYDGNTITQSMAIMEFLEDLFPNTKMLPKKDPVKKARVLEICEIINSGIQPLQNLSVIVKFSDDTSKRTEWANFWIAKGFNAVENILSKSSGKYCVGDDVSWADCSLVPQVFAAQRFKVDINLYPNILKVYNNLSELDSFKKAHAFVQPDCPPDLRQ